MNHLTTHNLAIGYTARRQPKTVATNINVALRPGELVALIGPNGAGKSTLMRTLAGMQKPLRGQVCLGQDDLHRLPPDQLAKRLAIVLTERVDVGNLSAYALVGLGRHPYTDWRGTLTANDEAIVRWALTAVGASELAARPLDELSDGERQKVMIARALAQEPQVLILDEPTAFLDLPRRVELMRLLANLAYTTKRAILLSTHDLELALRVADRLWLLPTGGSLLDGMPEELALNGTLAAAFASEGVEFDSAAGAFKLHRHPCGPIVLHGDGLLAQWTARALERIGYQVVGREGVAAIQISVGDNHWRVTNGLRQAEYGSLAELIEAVKQPLVGENKELVIGNK